MDFIEVLERRRHLRQNGRRIAQIHAPYVALLDGIDEALGHAVALGGCTSAYFPASAPDNFAYLVRDIGATVAG